MKTFLTGLLFCAFGVQNYISAQEPQWGQNLEVAFKRASKSQQPILVYFTGSDWCAPCKSLKKNILDTQKFKDLATQMVLVEIDWPRKIDLYTERQMAYNKTINQRYNKEKSFPKLLFLNPKGHVLDELIGYSTYGQDDLYFRFFKKNLK